MFSKSERLLGSWWGAMTECLVHQLSYRQSRCITIGGQDGTNGEPELVEEGQHAIVHQVAAVVGIFEA